MLDGPLAARDRDVRGTSLRVVAGRAGISPSYLSQLESGARALDRHFLIVSLADALGTSPPELTKLPIPAPGNGGTDGAIEAVRQALPVVGHQRPGGQVVPVEALRALDSVTVPTDIPEAAQLAGMLALSRSLLAAVDSRPGDVAAPFEQAVELAERTGEGNAYGIGFGPTTVGLWRMYSQLDVGDYARAVRVGARLHPETYLPRWGRPTTGSPLAGRCAGAGPPGRRRRGIASR